MTTPRLGAPELTLSQAIPETTVNRQLRYAEQGAGFFIVKDKDLATPPGSPADGDAYIVAASPTGAWTGHAKSIAFYLASAWAFIVPIEGTRAAVQDEDVDYRYDGSAWAIATSSFSAASSAETTTGTSITKAVTPDGLAGSDYGKRVVQIQVTDPNGSALSTGDGKAYFRVPSVMNGWNLVGVAAHVTTVSSSGAPSVQIHNVTQAADMLTTNITIDASEKDSSTAATPAVIDTGNDDVATGDELRIDIDAAGTGAKGLIVEMQFQLP